jgi:hypothetical protein
VFFSFYWPWAEFDPPSRAYPDLTRARPGSSPAPIIAYPTPSRQRDRNASGQNRTKYRIPVEFDSLEIEPHTRMRLSTRNPYKYRAVASGSRGKPRQTIDSPLSSPRHMRRSSSSIDPTSVFYVLRRTHLAQPCREPTFGAFLHRRRRLRLEPCRRTSCSGAPRW